ncbi:MAG: exo-alpha-sialidase [Acidobacteria bacterium]|nr:exo-alpha-sialidase [Acidobacteriota bacterium]
MPVELTRRQALTISGAAWLGQTRLQAAEPERVTVRAEAGWYMHSAGVAAYADGEIVCTYRRSDEHIASIVEIWCCRSRDGGRTWSDHRLISTSSYERDQACWVAPQLGKLKDGTLLLLADRGRKTSKFDWPMLSQWQQPPRGMSNWLFVSRDRGRTWQAPRQIDAVGGEPSYIMQMSKGTLLYTRTDSRPTDAKKVPAMPWGPNYYRSTAVFSDDNGRSWKRTVALADDPLVGDCEVGVAEYAAGRLLAITRIGDAGSALGQPSRFVLSGDSGSHWDKPVLGPIYAHRPIVKPLMDGRLLVSFRNAWGTPSTCLFAFHPEEKLGWQPNSLLWDESRCTLSKEWMEIHTREGRQSAAEFTLYPLEDDDSSVEFEAELQVLEAGANAVNICAGAWIRLLPNRVEIADQPQAGFDIDARQWHRYRIRNAGQTITVFADGVKRLEVPNKDLFTRHVRFGNRSGATPASSREGRKPLRGTEYVTNGGLSRWRYIHVAVKNRRDHSIDWTWTPASGYPDQFRRSRVLRLEKCGTFAAGDCGYSGWDQLRDRNVVVVDYTTTAEGLTHPILRAYRVPAKSLA